MTDVRQKLAERAFVEQVQQHYPGYLPTSRARDFEHPDFLFDDEGATVGIEVMQLFHPAEGGQPFPETEVATFHRQLVERAGEIHGLLQPSRPLDVRTYYDRRVPLKGRETCARALAEFVATLDHGTATRSPESPQGMSVVSLFPAKRPDSPEWTCWGNSHGLLLTQEFLAGEVAKKNVHVPRYRHHAERVYLLLVSSLASLESTFAAPPEITQWRFDFDFDRVFVLVQDPGELHELARRDIIRSDSSR